MESLRSTANILVLGLITILIVLSGPAVTSAQAVGTEPTVVQAIPPGYPPIALAVDIGGEVTVEATINLQGDVTATKTIAGHKLLSPAAERAASRWKFNQLEQGVNERTVRLYFKFRLVPRNGVQSDIVIIFWPPYRVEVSGVTGRIVQRRSTQQSTPPNSLD